MRAIDEHIGTRMSGTARAVLQALAGSYNDIERAAWPRIETLMEKTGYSRPSIFRAINQLVAREIVIRQGGGGRGKPDVFRLPCVEKRLGEKGLTSETVSEGKGSHFRDLKGLTFETKTVSLLRQPSTKETVTNTVTEPGTTRARACEDTPEIAAKPAKVAASGPHQEVVDHYNGLWLLDRLTFPGGKGVVIRDLAQLRARCATPTDNGVADSKAILSAFHAGLNGDRPHMQTVIDHVGRWQQAGKPTRYDGRYHPEGGTNGKSRTTSLVNADRRPDGTERFGGETQAANDRTLRRIAERHRVPAV